MTHPSWCLASPIRPGSLGTQGTGCVFESLRGSRVCRAPLQAGRGGAGAQENGQVAIAHRSCAREGHRQVGCARERGGLQWLRRLSAPPPNVCARIRRRARICLAACLHHTPCCGRPLLAVERCGVLGGGAVATTIGSAMDRSATWEVSLTTCLAGLGRGDRAESSLLGAGDRPTELGREMTHD